MSFPCYFGCGNVLTTKFDMKAIEMWDWFCGYAEHPIHFCPDCRKNRQPEIDRLRVVLNTKPEGYPGKYAPIPEPGAT